MTNEKGPNAQGPNPIFTQLSMNYQMLKTYGFSGGGVWFGRGCLFICRFSIISC